MQPESERKKLIEAGRLLALGELHIHTGGDDPLGKPADETDEALAAFGLVRDGPAPAHICRDFHLWTEHVPAMRLWFAVKTQWRHGFDGPTGLDYAGVRAAPAFRQIEPTKREHVFGDLCSMERGALLGIASLRHTA